MVKLATAHLWRVFYQFSVAVVLLTMNSQQTDESSQQYFVLSFQDSK